MVGCLTELREKVEAAASAVRLWKARDEMETGVEVDARSNGLAAPARAKDLIRDGR